MITTHYQLLNNNKNGWCGMICFALSMYISVIDVNLLDDMDRILQSCLDQIQRLKQDSGKCARKGAGEERFHNGILQIKRAFVNQN